MTRYLRAVLSVLCLIVILLMIINVVRPIRFSRERQRRETVVAARMNSISEAQETFRRLNGFFCPDFATLVAKHYLADTMRFIPYSGGEEFTLQVSAVIGHAGNAISTLDISAPYSAYLRGMNKQMIDRIEQEAADEGRYPGMVVRN